MANEVNIYSPRYLAEVVRQTPAVHTYFRDTFFTNVKTFATAAWRPLSIPAWAARC